MKWFSGRTGILARASLLGVVAAACSDMAGVRPANGITVRVIGAPAGEPALTRGPLGAVELAELRLVLGGVKLETGRAVTLVRRYQWAPAQQR